MMSSNNVIINPDEELHELLGYDRIKIIQKKDGFKFGIDAVLLSDFAQVKKRHRVMDLCTGTGIVPFLVYGKYEPQSIFGLEIQRDMVEMAERSVRMNNLEEKLHFINHDLKAWQILAMACGTAAVMELIEFIFSWPGGILVKDRDNNNAYG